MGCTPEEARKSIIDKAYAKTFRRLVENRHTYNWKADEERVQIINTPIDIAINVAKGLSTRLNNALKKDLSTNYGNHLYTFFKKDYFTEQVYVEIFTSQAYVQHEMKVIDAKRALENRQVTPIERFSKLEEEPFAPVKEGVPDLFESNPELANAVYEALGFKSKFDELDLPPFGDTYNEYIPYRENKLNGRDIDRLSIIAEVLEDTTNEELYALIKSELAKSDKYKDDSKFLSSRDFYSWLGDIKVKGIRKDIEEYKQGNRFKGKDVLKAITNTPFSEYVNMLLGLKKESKKTTKQEITPQQKQQALQLYSQYLDTIFPDSKLKDIVYRGGEKEDTRLFQYWTNNKAEAYMYAKANITKGGNITERNPILVITDNLKKYINDKYGEKSFESYILNEQDYYNQVSETEYEVQLPTWYKEGIKLDKQDIEDITALETLKANYDKVKIENEDDLDKPYTVNDYDVYKRDYDEARKQLNKYFNIEEVGKIKTAILNIKNPYTEEIVQEDLQNDRDAYKNGHDGAFLMDGDHFLVKSNTEQIHVLGGKQDIEGFKKFVAGTKVATAIPTRVEEEPLDIDIQDAIDTTSQIDSGDLDDIGFEGEVCGI